MRPLAQHMSDPPSADARASTKERKKEDCDYQLVVVYVSRVNPSDTSPGAMDVSPGAMAVGPSERRRACIFTDSQKECDYM